MKYATASRLDVMIKCPPSYAMPRVEGSSVVENDDPHALLGTAKHSFLADVLDFGVEEALRRCPEEYVEACQRLPVDQLPAAQPGSYAAEVAYAWDFEADTAREIGRRLGRNYGDLGEHELAGSSDLEALSADGDTSIVADYKSGFRRVEPARENLQIRSLCLFAARTRGTTKARGVIYYVPEDGDVETDVAEFDAFDLALIAAELRVYSATVDKVREEIRAHGYLGLDEVTTGPHCRRCPAYKVCPATAALLARAAAPADLVTDFRALLRPETPEQARRLVERVEQLAEQMRRDLDAFATVNPWETREGYVYGPVVVKTDEIDGAIAREALAKEFGRGVADAAVVGKVSKTRSLKDALRLIAPRGQLAAYERRALEVIGEAGGITVKTHVEVREHRRG